MRAHEACEVLFSSDRGRHKRSICQCSTALIHKLQRASSPRPQMKSDTSPLQLPVKKRKAGSLGAKEEESALEEAITVKGTEEQPPQQKRVSITTSKILGTAQPHKPRIGPRYQAELPPLLQPKRAQGAPK